MIYIDVDTDVVNILTYINEFTRRAGILDAQVDSDLVAKVCIDMRRKFPHVDGLDKASTFKKVANFVAWFVCHQPIKSAFPAGSVRGIEADLNASAVIAFDIALLCLQGSVISSKNGEKSISENLYVSDHSYADIIHSLAGHVEPSTHYHLLAVLFEQITYKSNPHCEYGHEDGETNAYYPRVYPLTGDDLAGV